MRATRMAVAVAALTKSILDAGTIRANARLQAARIYNRPSAITNASTVPADGALAAR